MPLVTLKEMIKRGIPMLQFTDVNALRTHYAGIRAKFRGPVTYCPPLRPVEAPEVVVIPDPQIRFPDPSDIPQEMLDEYNKYFTKSTKSRVRAIVREVSEKHCVKAEDILSQSRKRTLVVARQEAMYRVRTEVGKSLLEIARHFNRDHSTVMHSIETHGKRIAA